MSFPMAINRLSGQRIITTAAKHNLREIVAEIGADKHIDPTRSADNIVLRGPVTADGVAALRKSLLDAAKLKKKLRVDAVQGLEVLFTWPFPGQECPLQYFEDCTRWAENHFNVPVLSSVVHLDESQPHQWTYERLRFVWDRSQATHALRLVLSACRRKLRYHSPTSEASSKCRDT
jgi:hypothetical protein